MNNTYCKVILKTKDENKILSFRTKKLPEINDELVLYYDGENRFVKVDQVSAKPFPEIFATEIGDSPF
ncbi:MAG: hypothetical protein JST47_12580 [Bacteroidetes bacterium]|nr:hypothetical protein [Bacteroidota bacterium]